MPEGLTSVLTSENHISVFTDIEGRKRSFKTDDIFGLPGSPIEHVYVVQSGLVSLVVQLRSGDQIETGMVGPGGLVGASALAGATWPNVFVAQSRVEAWEMRTSDFVAAVKQDPKLHDLAFRHVQWLMVQAQQTAACNGAHQLEARLATWLLRAHDLTGWIEIPFTQDTISKLLAVKRPSVSMVMAELHRENVVSYTRGNIGLSDRNRLEQRACECFRILRSRRDEVLGPSCSEGSSARRA